MKFIKWLLAIIGVLVLIWLGLWAVGVIYGLLFYVFWIAVIGAIGYGGYKLLSRGDKTRELEDGMPIAIAEMRTDRVLEEYKRKFND